MLEYSKIVLKTYNGEHEDIKRFHMGGRKTVYMGRFAPIRDCYKSMFSDVSFERLYRFVEDIVKLGLFWNILK